MSSGATPRRVGVVGHGAVGSVLADALEGDPASEARSDLVLAGVYAHSPVPDRYRADSFEELLDRSDLVVEAASQEAVAAYGPTTVEAGTDLLVVSVGALRDEALLDRLRSGPGRLLVTTGAIGGIDQLRAAALLGGLDRVELTTTKPARALVQPWMDDDLTAALNDPDATAPVTVYDGPAREAVERFPRSVNVAATLSLTTVGFERVRVRLIADPTTDHVEHRVGASGAAGSYEFRFRNVASEANVRTSAVTPYAVLRGLRDLDAHVVIGF